MPTVALLRGQFSCLRAYMTRHCRTPPRNLEIALVCSCRNGEPFHRPDHRQGGTATLYASRMPHVEGRRGPVTCQKKKKIQTSVLNDPPKHDPQNMLPRRTWHLVLDGRLYVRHAYKREREDPGKPSQLTCKLQFQCYHISHYQHDKASWPSTNTNDDIVINLDR